MRQRYVALLIVLIVSGVAADTAAAAAGLAVTRVRPVWTGISVIGLDGTRTTLTRHRGWLDDHAEFSPDRRHIAFTRSRDGSRSFRVFVMGADGSRVHRVTSGRFDERPTWSPDGRWIAYQASDGIRLVRPNGRGDHALPQSAGAASPAWSPDSQRLAFTRGAWIVTARPDGTDQRRVVRGREPDFSPDGDTLAYTGPGGGVFTVPTQGGTGRLLHTGMQPAFSADGARIAFTRWPASGRFSVWVMNADGSGAHRLATDARSPAW